MKKVVVIVLVMMEMNWLKWISVSLVFWKLIWKPLEPRVGSGFFSLFKCYFQTVVNLSLMFASRTNAVMLHLKLESQ